MSEFIREMEEDMRAVRLREMWQRHGNALIGVAIAIVIGTGAGEAWKSMRTGRHQQDTAHLIAAVAQGDRQEAALADLSKTASSGVGELAALRLGDAELKTGKPDAALVSYRSLENDSHDDEGLRALSGLLAETIAPGKSDTSLSTNAPFAAERREAAAWQLYKSGDATAAQHLFDTLAKDVNTPPGLRTRAAIMASYLQGA